MVQYKRRELSIRSSPEKIEFLKKLPWFPARIMRWFFLFYGVFGAFSDESCFDDKSNKL